MHFTFPGEKTRRDGRHWLVRDIIPFGGFAVMVGDPGSGKSTVAAGLAAAVATGSSWLGLATKQAAVVYLAERNDEAETRRDVLVDADPMVPFAVVPIFDISEPSAAQVVITICKAVSLRGGAPVGLVIIDTFARGFSGDENSSRDVGNFVRALDGIRTQTDAAILVIHHTTKPSSDARARRRIQARGSGALLGAVDVELIVAAENGNGTITVTKSNASKVGRKLEFRLEVVSLHSEMGTIDEVTIARAVPCDVAVTTRLSAHAKMLWSIIEDKGGHVDRPTILEEMRRSAKLSSDRATSSSQVKRALDDLRDAGVIEFDPKIASIRQPTPNLTHHPNTS